ncbi:transposase [Enterobacter cloacae]|uniref:Transposase DDE domain-containing protein n=1 Tax=Enterobacter cloacae TaxID=550 RepID=A0A427KE91_ENTCL|nr:transposase [Enterobacter cloacae]MBF4114184.1 transposase [Enterobacter cloacae]RSB24439.1 hypothetical protein EGK68_24760 [Enterobacter cloacae]
MDNGYKAEGWRFVRKLAVMNLISSRGRRSQRRLKNTDFRTHRWVVEKTYGWMNRFRRVLTRCEKKVENYEAMLHFVCSIIVWNKILLG